MRAGTYWALNLVASLFVYDLFEVSLVSSLPFLISELIFDEAVLTKPVYFVFLCPFRALALAFECFDEVACDADDCVAELLEFAATPGLASGRSTIAEESGSHILLLVPHCFAFRFFSLLVVAVCWGGGPHPVGGGGWGC